MNNLIIAITKMYHTDLVRCQEKTEAKQFCSLDYFEIEKLSERVEVLPIAFRSILYFYYYFHFSIEEIESIMGKLQINEKRLYAETILSEFMGLFDCRLDFHSLSIACELALKREVDAGNSEE